MDGELPNRSKMNPTDGPRLSEVVLDVHPFATYIPEMSKEEYAGFREDIRQNGLKSPILLYEGKILDGRHRYKACRETGVECKFETYAGDKALAEVVSFNLKRRSLTTGQRAVIAVRLANLDRGHKANTANAVTQEQAAAMCSVSVDTLQRAKIVLEQGTSAVRRAMLDGLISVNRAAAIAAMPPKKQSKALRAARKSFPPPPDTNEDLFASIQYDAQCISTDTYDIIVEIAIAAIDELDRSISDAIWSLAPSDREQTHAITSQYRKRVEGLVHHFQKQLNQLPRRARFDDDASRMS